MHLAITGETVWKVLIYNFAHFFNLFLCLQLPFALHFETIIITTTIIIIILKSFICINFFPIPITNHSSKFSVKIKEKKMIIKFITVSKQTLTTDNCNYARYLIIAATADIIFNFFFFFFFFKYLLCLLLLMCHGRYAIFIFLSRSASDLFFQARNFDLESLHCMHPSKMLFTFILMDFFHKCAPHPHVPFEHSSFQVIF